ncbi:enoyl-CoA hydratase-related protein [Aquaspirillum serpens]|uniref:enoyl-CoA hydratase-related protein n=1 Tax=Aquaspirillum serpens TaxID=190 RepID=UPI0003B3E490|nr:enoyl-CoA hydratase-related protein [Aquaspirillum serpens]
MEQVLRYHSQDGVVTLTLTRPDLHNPFGAALMQALNTALDRIEQETALRVVVLAAQGMSFSTGFENEWLLHLSQHANADIFSTEAATLSHLLARLDQLPVPVIARVQGSAFGVGLALIACADVAIAVPEALFGFSDVKLGWAPAVIAPYVQRAIGTRATRRYFVTAERFNARKAKRLELIHQIVAANELDHTVNMLIQHIKHNSPQAIAAAKRLLHELETPRLDEAVQQRLIALTAENSQQAQAQEGLQAFVERRKPSWSI